MEGLQRFANHTRHRAARDGDLTQLARKWMVTHVAPTSPATYAFVANDYALVEARTHSPPLASYADRLHPVDVETFVWTAKNGYPANRPLTLEEEQQWPALAQFRDTLWPKPVDQEAWQPFERNDHWKERAYFLAAAGACKDRPQFHALVQAIYSEPLGSVTTETTEPKGSGGSGSSVDQISNLYTRILRVLPEPSAYELGTLIAALDLGEQQGGPSCEIARQEYLEEKQEAAAVEPVIEKEIPVILVNKDATQQEQQQHVSFEDAAIIAFRQRELIPPTFSKQKVIQQMLLTHLGVAVPSHLLASAQRRMSRQPMGPVSLSETVFDWIDEVPHDKWAAHLNLECPQVQAYYFGRADGSAGQPITAQALVRGLIQDERHRKRWPDVEPSLVKAITEI